MGENSNLGTTIVRRDRLTAIYGLMLLVGLASLPVFLKEIAQLPEHLAVLAGFPRKIFRDLQKVTLFMPLVGAITYARFSCIPVVDRPFRFGILLLAVLLCGVALLPSSMEDAALLACIALVIQFGATLLVGGQIVHCVRILQASFEDRASGRAGAIVTAALSAAFALTWVVATLAYVFLDRDGSVIFPWRPLFLTYGIGLTLVAAFQRPASTLWPEAVPKQLPNVWNNWHFLLRSMAISFFAASAITLVFQVNIVQSWEFLTRSLHVPRSRLVEILSASMFLALPLCAPIGWLSSRLGPKAMLLMGLSANALLLLPIFIMYARASGFFYGNPFEEVQPDILVLLTLSVINIALAAAVIIPAFSFLPSISKSTENLRAFCWGFFLVGIATSLMQNLVRKALLILTNGSFYAPTTAAIILILVLAPLVGVFAQSPQQNGGKALLTGE